MQTRCAVLILGVVLSLTGSGAAQQPDASATPLPELPSSGALALTIDRATEPGIPALWRRALASARADVRATAARLAGAARVAELVPDLFKANAVETDVAAKAEILRALLVLGNPATRRAVLVLARDLDPRVQELVVAHYAVHVGAKALQLLADPELATLVDDGATRAILLRNATGLEPDHLIDLATAALKGHDADQWALALSLLEEIEAELPGARQVAGLDSELPAIAVTTAWHLARTYAHAERPSHRRDLDTALDAALARSHALPIDDRFAFEILGRVLGRRAESNAEWLSAVGDGLRSQATDPALLASLTREELDAADTARAGRVPEPYSSLRKSMDSYRQARKRRPKIDADTAALREAVDYPPGFVAAVVRATGCKADARFAFAIADVTFSTNGAKTILLVAWPPSDKRCEQAASTLFAAAYPSPQRRNPGRTERLLVFLDPKRANCADSYWRVADPEDPGANDEITPPKLTHNPAPKYPPLSKEQGVDGTIEIDAVINPEGRACEMAVRRGGDLALQMATMEALSRWRFEPGTRNGEPVPVVFTLTINFTLDRHRR